MKFFENFARLCVLAIMSLAITSSASAFQAGSLTGYEATSPAKSFQSLIHRVHSVTVNDDGSRTVRHCKNEKECRYCTKKCLAPANCIAKDCCTEWSNSECRVGPPPEGLKVFN